MAQPMAKPISPQQGNETRSAPEDEKVFKAILSEDIDWKAFAAFPPSARLAVVAGRPSEPGLYTIRVKVPNGVKLMPHRHPEDRIYTVISGVFYIGLGDEFDADKLQAYPPGAVIACPATHPISTGRSPVTTLPKCRRLGRWAWDMLIRGTILGSTHDYNLPQRIRVHVKAVGSAQERLWQRISSRQETRMRLLHG